MCTNVLSLDGLLQQRYRTDGILFNARPANIVGSEFVLGLSVPCICCKGVPPGCFSMIRYSLVGRLYE